MSDFRNEKRRQELIGRRLRKMYDDVVSEPIPPDVIDLLGDSGAGVRPNVPKSGAGGAAASIPRPDKKD